MQFSVQLLQNSCVLLYLLILILPYSTAFPLTTDGDSLSQSVPESLLDSNAEKLQDHIKILRDTLLFKDDKQKLESLKEFLSRAELQKSGVPSSSDYESSIAEAQSERLEFLSSTSKDGTNTSSTTKDIVPFNGITQERPSPSRDTAPKLSASQPIEIESSQNTILSSETAFQSGPSQDVATPDDQLQAEGIVNYVEKNAPLVEKSLQTTTVTSTLDPKGERVRVTHTVTHYLSSDNTLIATPTSHSQDMHILPISTANTEIATYTLPVAPNVISSEQYDHLMKVLQEVKSKVSEQERKEAEKLELQRKLEEREQAKKQREQMELQNLEQEKQREKQRLENLKRLELQRTLEKEKEMEKEMEIRLKVEHELRAKFERELEIQRQREEEEKQKSAAAEREQEERMQGYIRLEGSHESKGGSDEHSETTSYTKELQKSQEPTEKSSTLDHNSESAFESTVTTIIAMSTISRETPSPTATNTAPRVKTGPSLKGILNQKNPSYKLSVKPQFKYHDREHVPDSQEKVGYFKPKSTDNGIIGEVEPASSNPETESKSSVSLFTTSSSLSPSSSWIATSTRTTALSKSHYDSSTFSLPMTTIATTSSTSAHSKRPQSIPSHDLKHSLEKFPGEDTFNYFERIFPDLKALMDNVHTEKVQTSSQHDDSDSLARTVPTKATFASANEVVESDGVIYEYVYEDDSNDSPKPPASLLLEPISTSLPEDDPSTILHMPKELQNEIALENNPFSTFKSKEELRSSYLKQQHNGNDENKLSKLSTQSDNGYVDKHHNPSTHSAKATSRHRFKYQSLGKKQPHGSTKSISQHEVDDWTADTSSSRHAKAKHHRLKGAHHRKHKSGGGDRQGVDFDVFGLGDAKENGAQHLSVQYCSSYVAAITLIAAGILLYL